MPMIPGVVRCGASVMAWASCRQSSTWGRAPATLRNGTVFRAINAAIKQRGRRLLLFALLAAYGVLADRAGGLGVPCLWQRLLHVSCPGCGLSRAGALLVRGRIIEAAEMNGLIFVVIPVVCWHVAHGQFSTGP